MENSENIDFLFFIDAGNVWGVDYDSSIDNGGEIRSSFGIGIDWLTPVGPLNFTLAETLSKADGDVRVLDLIWVQLLMKKIIIVIITIILFLSNNSF